jgi:hypothetical protein
MKRLLLITPLVVLAHQLLVAAEAEQRSVETGFGRMTLAVPKDWPAIETQRTSRGGAFYRGGPANTKYFYFNLYLNNPGQTMTNALTDATLEDFLKSSLSALAKQSEEGKVQLHRFGARKDGVYARFTDRAPKPDEYLYFSRGVRLVGTNILTFSLVSNDSDGSAVSNTLAVIESVKVGGK